MPLQLEIVSDHRELMGDDSVRVFREQSGTIGRSLQNDWILPDPDRFISGRHATIDYKGGMYYLVDTSSNGVYVNGDCEPLGKGNPQRLFNGDRLRFGDFEILVTIDTGESLQMPVTESLDGLREHAKSLVEEEALKTGMLLLDEEEITGDDAFQSALFGGTADTGVARRAESVVADAMAREPAGTTESDAVAEHMPLAEADLVATDLLDSFLDGLGINRADFHPSTDLAELMQNAGEVLREFVDGTTQLLASRANMKNAFKLDQTTVLPRRNNPIKLSANVKDSIMQILVGRDGEYLGPRDAVREVCQDLLFHQDAILDAMTGAFVDFADRFDPAELEDGFNSSLGNGLLSRIGSKKKYWDMYCDAYPILTEKGDSRFPQMYAEEFVKAYEHQIAEFKRLGAADNHLKETVVLNKRDVTPEIDEDMADRTSTELAQIDIGSEEIALLESELATDAVANDDLLGDADLDDDTRSQA